MKSLWKTIADDAKTEWSERFIELAEKEIPHYSGDKDMYSPLPWCCPWMYGNADEAEFCTPEEWLAYVREDMADACQEDYEFENGLDDADSATQQIY